VAVIRRRRRCADCRVELEAGNNSGRCTDCLELLEAERDELADAYAPVADESTRTVIREGGDGRSLPPRVIGTQGDIEREPAQERRPARRQVPQHDHATRVAMKYAERMNETTTWDAIAGTPQGGRAVDFPPAQGTGAPAADGWGHPSRPRPSRYEGMVLANPAAMGVAFTPSSAAGDRAVHDQRHAHQQAGRFGPNVRADQVHAGQFESAPHLQAQEKIAASYAEAQRQALHANAGYLLPGR
jgi:hypothetical protein